MAKAFSVVSWNVQHFGATNKNNDNPKKPIEPIIEYLADQKADVIAVYEVVGKVVFEHIVKTMPGYQFHITEGPQTQEILVGVKKSFTSFFTQKIEFKSGAAALRPGALLTLIIDGRNYPLLFLHLKSFSVPKGFGLRDDMTQRAIDFRKALNKADARMGGNGKANYLFIGDLNTLGLKLTYSENDLSSNQEIERLRKRLSPSSVSMNLLDKSHSKTLWGGTESSYPPADVDHVIAANHLKFRKFGGTCVDVRGWIEESTDAKKYAWINKYSDHCLLYFEVQKAE